MADFGYSPKFKNGPKWQNGSRLHHFLNKVPFTKDSLASALSCLPFI